MEWDHFYILYGFSEMFDIFPDGRFLGNQDPNSPSSERPRSCKENCQHRVPDPSEIAKRLVRCCEKYPWGAPMFHGSYKTIHLWWPLVLFAQIGTEDHCKALGPQIKLYSTVSRRRSSRRRNFRKLTSSTTGVFGNLWDPFGIPQDAITTLNNL